MCTEQSQALDAALHFVFPRGQTMALHFFFFFLLMQQIPSTRHHCVVDRDSQQAGWTFQKTKENK